MMWVYQLAVLSLLVLSWFYSSTITYILIGTISLLVVFFLGRIDAFFLDDIDDLDEEKNERPD